ncbi:MAG TPA: TolC family protein [Tepidisphaeraceae bacterium]|nr:TolC family protein [Tepidisphaeraceae bacterium]
MKDFGTGGTGEWVVPQSQLHDIATTDFSRYATTRPADAQPTTSPASDFPPAQITLSIAECRASALRNNLDLKVSLYDPTIAHTSITEQEAAFESMFNGSANYSQSKSPGAGNVKTFTQYNLSPDANVTVPLLTGGSLKFDAPYSYQNNLGVFSLLNPSYTFNPNVTISQPLLRGFGFDVNAQGIRIAFYQYEQAQARTKLEVIRVLADTDRAYWALYASQAILQVRRQQYDLAVAQLQRARRQVRAGVIAQPDVVRAESGVADQVEAIIIAGNDVRQKERDLKRILNRADLPIESFTKIVPGTRPSAISYNVDAGYLTRAAMTQRMEMLNIELQIVTETANIRIARNAMLPLLSVQYSYSHLGFSGSPSTTFEQVWNKDYEGNNVGLTLQIPLGNEAAKSQLRRALLNRLQQLATKQQQAAQIRQDVYNAVDTLNTDWQRILAAHERVTLADRVLRVEVRQFNLGLRTSTDVLIAQSSLADAQSSEISAITDYQVAQVDLAFATGTSLGASRVDWQPEGKDVERSVQ